MIKNFTTTIHDLAFGGDGVGSVDGKVCFVRGALPGEEVVFEVNKQTKSYIKGEVIDIKTASLNRIKPACEYYGVCGGCQYQHLNYKKEIEYKKAQVENLMQRFGGLKDFSEKIVGEGLVSSRDNGYFYRDSITLHKGNNGYGFYGIDNKEIVSVSQCLIAAKELNAVLPGLQNIDISRLTIKHDHRGQTWRSDSGENLFYSDTYCGKELWFSSRGFSQCNRFIISQIVKELNLWINNTADGAVLFDVYCGVGFFSFLLEGFALYVGIDYEGISIDCAQKTANQSDQNNRVFYKGLVEKIFKNAFDKHKKKHNIVMLDPPRNGLDKNLVQWLRLNKEIDAIYYLSCDPAVMARDIKLLCEAGVWQLKRFKVFDMFARTFHVECLGEFFRSAL